MSKFTIQDLTLFGLLVALRKLMGQDVSEKILFEEILALEQRLTTGGGWQDQVGGLVSE